MSTFFQIGIAVPDLEAAMAELGAALNIEWSGPRDREIDGWRLRVAFARTGPTYLELIEGPPDSIWAASPNGSIHHLGYWSDDLKADSARLVHAGMRLELDLGHARYYQGIESGTRIELIDRTREPDFHAKWGL